MKATNKANEGFKIQRSQREEFFNRKVLNRSENNENDESVTSEKKKLWKGKRKLK